MNTCVEETLQSVIRKSNFISFVDFKTMKFALNLKTKEYQTYDIKLKFPIRSIFS